MRILNPQKRYINSEKEPLNLKIQFTQTKKNALSNNLQLFLNQKDQYNNEKKESNFYRIYGTINMLSPLVHKKNNITTKTELFEVSFDYDRITFANYFNIFLVKQHSINENTNTKQIIYEVLTDVRDFDIYNASFANNIFGEQIYNFNLRKYFEILDNDIFIYFSLKTETVFKGDLLDGEIYDVETDELITDFKKDFSFNIDSVDIFFYFNRLYKIKIREFNEITDVYEKIDFMFVNNKHYVYNNIVFKVLPNINDENTKSLYDNFITSYNDEILFDQDETLNNKC